MASAGEIYRNYTSTDTTSQSLRSNPLPQPPTSWGREGYFFKEWNTSRDGSGTSCQPGDNIPPAGVVYAIWYGDYIEAVKDSSSVEHPIKDTISGYITSASVPSASSTTPKMDGTAAVGTETAFARGDHIHPTDTSRQAKITASGILKGDGSGGVTAATAGTDYMTPANVSGNYVPLSKSSGGSVVTITDSPLLNSNTFSIEAANGSYTSKLNLYIDPNTGVQSAYLKAGSNTLKVSNTTTTIKNVTTPSADGDAANKKYVDDSIGALDGGTIGTGGTTKTITSLSQSNGNVSATFSDIAFPVTSVNGQTGAVTTAEKFVITATAISGTNYYNLDKTFADINVAIGDNKYVTIEDIDMTYPYTTTVSQGVVFGATLIATGEGNQLMAVTDGILVVQPDSGTNAMGIAVHSTNVLPTTSDIPSPSNTTPLMDGTADVGIQTYIYARADHVHPTDTSRQAVLVSGTNIKTINNESILGSGNISISAGTSSIILEGTYTTPSNLYVQKTPTELYNYLGAGTVVYIKGIYDDENPYFRQRTNSLYRLNSVELQGEGNNSFYKASITSHLNVIGDNDTTIVYGYASGQISDTSVAFTLMPIETDSANATNSTSKLFLVGATSQTASPATYSNSNVYATNGVLNAKSFSVDASANIVYNSSSKSIDFTFV